MLPFLKNQSKRSLNLKVLFIFIVIVLDAVSTVWLMYQGYGELNPVMAWVVEVWSVPGMAIVKIIWSLCLLLLVMRLKIFDKYIDYLIIAYFILYAGGWWIQFAWEVEKWTR